MEQGSAASSCVKVSLCINSLHLTVVNLGAMSCLIFHIMVYWSYWSDKVTPGNYIKTKQYFYRLRRSEEQRQVQADS